MSDAQLSLRPRPPYLLGLLCVIPFLGFIAGILIVLTGIYRYKDKGFITIGISGIIFTAVYALLL